MAPVNNVICVVGEFGSHQFLKLFELFGNLGLVVLVGLLGVHGVKELNMFKSCLSLHDNPLILIFGLLLDLLPNIASKPSRYFGGSSLRIYEQPHSFEISKCRLC